MKFRHSLHEDFLQMAFRLFFNEISCLILKFKIEILCKKKAKYNIEKYLWYISIIMNARKKNLLSYSTEMKSM
jgi:hypothetical protein